MGFFQCNTRSAAIVLCMGALLLCTLTPSTHADESDDLVKQIEKALSGVNRRIVTEPSRAEKELIGAQGLLAQLKASSPDHNKIPTLEATFGTLTKKLEKRLGRPVGRSAKKEVEKPKKRKEPPSDLPSSVLSRLKKMDAALSAVDAALEKDQLQTATRKLGEAKKLMAEIEKRYGAKIPDGNEEFLSAVARLEEMDQKVSGAVKSAADGAAADAAARQEKEAQSQEWIDRFGLFFDHGSDSYLRMGAEFNRASDEEKKQTRDAFARANALLPLYEKAEFAQGKTTELLNLERRLVEYVTRYNEEEARARQAESCSKWVDAFREYVDVGKGSKKYLILGATLDEKEIENRAALLDEARKCWNDYEKAEFPLGKSPRLIDLEKEMEQRLGAMPEILRQSRALVSGNMEKEFERILNYVEADTGWQGDITKSPNTVMKRDLDPLREALDRYAGTVAADDAQLAHLKKTLARITEQDRKNRAIRAERTYMRPDRYKGADSDDLRTKAAAIVLDKFTQAKKLRITLFAEQWKEESVLEWTDTTRSALRHRTTRSMTAQVAAKGTDGKVYLHSVHLASDRTSDGNWGPLYGHVMWSDWMAEKNVSKAPPLK